MKMITNIDFIIILIIIFFISALSCKSTEYEACIILAFNEISSAEEDLFFFERVFLHLMKSEALP